MTIKVGCDDKDALVAYLYEETTPEERQAVEAHLATCAACRRELEDLGGVRASLGSWAPPEPELGFRIVRDEPARGRRLWWRAPAWGLGLAATAVLVLAAAAAATHLEVRYDDRGFTVRTGWRSPADTGAATPVMAGGAAPWRADLQALEQRLRQDLAARPAMTGVTAASVAAARPVPAMDGAAVLRRVAALITDSEARQQRELALRLTEIMRDVDQQRRTDWVRISQGFGRLEELAGAGAAQQREVLNYLMRVTQQR